MTPTADDLATPLREAGAVGWVHAIDIDTGRELGLRPDQPVAISSVAKLPLLVALHRRADAGVVDLRKPVKVPVKGRTAGVTGVSLFADAATISLRDLALLMITISDNAAADVVFDAIGVDAVQEEMRALGLPGIAVRETLRDLLAAMDAITDRKRLLDPGRGNSATPRDLTALLRALWRDEAASPEACASMRRMMGFQVWPHRLASGFPFEDVRVSGKTGSLPTMRHEIGVVEYPDGGRYAVAVLTQTASPAAAQPQADAAIGAVARIAVERLRADR